MNKKVYKSSERAIPRRMRSDRHNVLPTSSGSYGVQTSGQSGSSEGADGGHEHNNMALLQSLKENDGYLEINDEKIKSGYADEAFDLSADSPIRELFVKRLEDDIVEGRLTMRQLLTVMLGIDGKSWQIDKDGVARLLQIYANGMTGNSFTTDDILTGQGFKISTDENGDGRMVTDYLTVRKKWFAMMLEVVKRQYSGGNWVFGSAGNVFIDVEAYDVRGVRVLLDKDLNKEHRDLEVLTWVSTPADCYTWINSHEVQYGGDGLFAVDSVSDLIRIVRSPSGSYTEQLYGCRVGDMFTEYDKTGGDYIVLTDDGWVDYDLMSEADRLGMVSYFRCYFLASDGDKQVDNMWYIGDQAYCQTININAGVTHQASNTLYWRLVVGKGENVEHKDLSCHYIDLSNELSVDVVDEQGTLHAGCIGYDATSGVEKEVSEIYDNRYCRLNYIQTDSGAWVEDVFALTSDFLDSEIRIEGDIAVLNGGEVANLIGAEVRKDGTFNYLNVAVVANGTAAFAYGDGITYVSVPNSAGKKLHLSAEMRDGAQICHVESTDIDVTETGSSSMTSAVKERLAGFTLGAMGRHTRYEDGYDPYELNGPQRYYEAKIYSDGVLVLHLVPAEDLLSGDYYLYDTVSARALPIYKWPATRITSGGIYKKRVTLADNPSVEDNVSQMGHQWNAERQHLVQIVVTGTEAPLLEGLAGINDYSLADKWVYRLSPKGIKMRADLLEMFTGTSEHGGGGVTVWRGNWMRGQTYYRNDLVKYDGSTWICIVAKGSSTMQEPSDNSTAWDVYSEKGEKGDDGRGLNILGSADVHVETTAAALSWLADKSTLLTYIILNDIKTTSGASPIAERWKYNVRTGWLGTGITSELGVGFTIHDDATGNDDLWLLTESGWDNRGAFSFKGEDGKDGEFILLEPDTLMLQQKFSRNAQGDLEFFWSGYNTTTVRHMVGDTEKNDITSITLTWVANDDGKVYSFYYTIAGNEIRVAYPLRETKKSQRGRAEIRVVAGDKEFVRYLTVVANALGTYHSETMADVTTTIRKRSVWQFDDNGVEQKYNYENQSYENALQKSKWITKIVNGSVEGGTLMQQTAEFIHFGFVSGVNYDEAEEVITGKFKTGLKISEDGSEFTGDVYTLIEQEGSDEGIYGWRLSHDGSGSLAQGKISWTTDGTLTAKEGVFEKIQVVQSEIQKSVWSASGKDSQGHYGTYVNVGSLNDGSNTTALSVRHDYHTNCMGEDWFAVLSYGNGGNLHLLSYHDWMTLQPNQLQYKGSNDSQRKTLADWASTSMKMHVPLVGVRRKLIELTSAGTIDLSEAENEDYETIICRHSSGAATVKLPVEPAIANGKEITISQRVKDGTIKIQKHTTATAQIRIAGAAPADEITLPYEAEYDWIERHGAENINHKNKMVYWGVKLIYNNNIWEALLMV